MRTSAGRAVEILDIHDADLVASRRGLAKPELLDLLGRDLVRPDFAALGHDAVGERFRLGHARRVAQRDVDARAQRPQMERERRGIERLHEGLRQHVLAGVLLHVIETPRGVDARLPRPRAGIALDPVIDPFLLVGHLDDPRLAQRPDVMRLAARGRIEQRLREHDRATPLAHDQRRVGSFEFEGVRVVVVEPPAHEAAGRPPPSPVGRISLSFRHSVAREIPRARAVRLMLLRCRSSVRVMCRRSSSSSVMSSSGTRS